MENNKNIEKIYDLIEQFDFAELSEPDRLLVLSVISESKYAEMRNTFNNLKLELTEDDDIEPAINIPKIESVDSDSRIKRILNYPIKFYQVAASVAIIISIFSLFQQSSKNENYSMIAKNDTLIIQKIDTVYSIVHDTVEIIREKVRIAQKDFQIQKENDLSANSNIKTDCSNNICPNEMDDFIAMNSRNTIKNDTTLKGVLLSLN
jgi:hypothetical protein